MASQESPQNHTLGLDLQPFIPSLLESNYIAPFLIFIHKFIQTPINQKHSKKKILDSLSLHYPNSFSLKLAKLLSLNPPIHIRNEAVSLLRKTLSVTRANHIHRIRCDIFAELKSLILQHFKVETEEQLLPSLAATIAGLAYRIYALPLGGWLELLEYIVSCVSLKSNNDDSVLKQRKGMMLLADLPGTIAEHEVFWKKHYSVLCQNLAARMINGNADENLQALAFDSLHMTLKIAQPLGECRIRGSIFLILLKFLDRHSNEEIVVKRVRRLREFVYFMNVDLVLIGKEGNVFRAILRIVAKNGACNEVRCGGIAVLNRLWGDRLNIMEAVMKKLSDVDAQRVTKVSMDMMFESDSQCYEYGKTFLNWLSFRGKGSFVFHMLMSFLKTTYAASEDFKKRHTVMMDIAKFANENISDGSVFAPEIVKMIANEINHALSSIVDCERTKAGIVEGGSEYILEEEIIRVLSSDLNTKQIVFESSRFLLSITSDLKDRLSPHVEELFSTIAQFLGNDFPDRVNAIAFSFLNIIGPRFPDEFQIYHDRYVRELLKARQGSLNTQMGTSEGIGICAKYGGQKFKTIVNEAISKLYSLIEHEHSINGERFSYSAYISDIAVEALGLICKFHWENIDGRPEVIRNWLSFLPLSDDYDLAKNVHGQLSNMLKREDVDVLGPNNENLPKILSILRAILSRRDKLATEETSSEMIEFLDKHVHDMQ